jgi:hypothetical protein
LGESLQYERHRNQIAGFLYEQRETGWIGQPEMNLLFGLGDTSAGDRSQWQSDLGLPCSVSRCPKASYGRGIGPARSAGCQHQPTLAERGQRHARGRTELAAATGRPPPAVRFDPAAQPGERVTRGQAQ